MTGGPDPDGLRTAQLILPDVEDGLTPADFRYREMGGDDFFDGPELGESPLLRS